MLSPKLVELRLVIVGDCDKLCTNQKKFNLMVGHGNLLRSRVFFMQKK